MFAFVARGLLGRVRLAQSDRCCKKSDDGRRAKYPVNHGNLSPAAANRHRHGSSLAGACVLLATKPEYDTRGIAHVILVITKFLRRTAKLRAVKLGRQVFDLNWLDSNVLCHVNAQATSGGSCECVLLLTVIRWTGPGVGATEEKVNVRTKPGMTPCESGTKQIS
jgi:hypothetical protein